MQESTPDTDASELTRYHNYSNAHQFILSHDVAIDEEITRFRDTTTTEEEKIMVGVIERILGCSLSGDLLHDLHDGVILCRLFKKLVPDREIRDPAVSDHLSVFQMRDNISIFTNACRSINIPDVLLITCSYFDTNNRKLLLSGLFTFIVWILNLGIPEPSCHVSVDNLFNEAKQHGVENCIEMLSNQLSDTIGRASSSTVDPAPGSVCESAVVVSAVPASVDVRESVTDPAHSTDTPPAAAPAAIPSAPDVSDSPRASGASDASDAHDAPPMSDASHTLHIADASDASHPSHIADALDALDALDASHTADAHNPASMPPRLSITQQRRQRWMDQHGVQQIAPDVDPAFRSRDVESAVTAFLVKIPAADEKEPLLQEPPHEIPSVAVATEEEVSFLSEEVSPDSPTETLQEKAVVEEHRRAPISPIVPAKRRNFVVNHPAIDTRHVQPRVYNHEMIPRKPELTYVERIGNRRMVAGVICQPRYIEGVDSEGRVWSRIQVRSVSSFAHPSLRGSRCAGGETKDEPAPIKRGRGLFPYDVDEPYEEGEMVRNALHNDNGPIAAEELERRLDEEIRMSLQSSNYLCLFVP